MGEVPAMITGRLFSVAGSCTGVLVKNMRLLSSFP